MERPHTSIHQLEGNFAVTGWLTCKGIHALPVWVYSCTTALRLCLA